MDPRHDYAHLWVFEESEHLSEDLRLESNICGDEKNNRGTLEQGKDTVVSPGLSLTPGEVRNDQAGIAEPEKIVGLGRVPFDGHDEPADPRTEDLRYDAFQPLLVVVGEERDAGLFQSHGFLRNVAGATSIWR